MTSSCEDDRVKDARLQIILNHIEVKLNSEVTLETDRNFIELALHRSPTGGNSKPFAWTWKDENTLSISHDVHLASHYLNRNQHTSLLALGCLLKSAEIAAESQGLKTETSINPDDLSAEIIFTKSDLQTESHSVSTTALLHRRTYRGTFAASEKPKELASSFDQDVQAHLIGSHEVLNETKDFLRKADSYLWLQKKATVQFFKELTFSRREQSTNDRGIRVVDLNLGLMDQITLYFFRFMPWLLSFIAEVPGLNATLKAASDRNLKNAHFVLITAKDLSAINLIKAGELALDVWLDLETQNYKVQPYSMASVTLLDAATDFLPDDTRENFRTLFKNSGPSVLKKQFKLSDSDKVVWLFRVGRES